MSSSYIRERILVLKQLIAYLGVRRFLNRLFYSYHEEIIFTKDFNEKTSLACKDRLKIQRIERDQLGDLVSLCRGPGVEDAHYLKELHEYLDNNSNGLIAKLNGETIGYLWWWDNKVKSNFRDIVFKFYLNEIKLEPREVFVFDFYISRKHRGYGIPAEFLIKSLDMGRRLGYERSFSYVRADNLPARWVYRITGNKETRRVKIRRLLLFLVLRDNKLFIDRDWRSATWHLKQKC